MARQSRQAQTPAAPAAAPRISVIDRRLKNPFGTPSREIPLAGEKRGWVTRTFASDPEHPNRHYDAVHRLGWLPVTREDVAGAIESLGFTEAPDKRIVRGAGGHEVLMAMPRGDFDAVQKAKADYNLSRLDPKKVRQDVAQATAQELGSEAGDATYR